MVARIDDATAVSSLPAVPAATGSPGYFAAVTPGSGTPTRVRSWWLNMVQEELAAVVQAAGIVLNRLSNSQLLAALQVLFRPKATSNLSLYVSTTGSDSNSGLSSATPFLTLQRAWNYVMGLDLNGYTVTVQLGAGTYASPLVATGSPVGSVGPSSVIFQGSILSPSTVIISTGNSPCVSAANGAMLTLQGVTLMNSGTSGQVNCINANLDANIAYNNIIFGASYSAHVVAGNGGNIVNTGTTTISGNAPAHLYTTSGGLIYSLGQVFTFTGTFSGSFATAAGGAITVAGFAVTNPSYATGVKYNFSAGGCISTNGGYTSLPGSSGSGTNGSTGFLS